MEEIINSIQNGQRKQALRQLSESSYIFEDLMEELLSQGMEDETVKMFRIALNMEYFSYTPNKFKKHIKNI